MCYEGALWSAIRDQPSSLPARRHRRVPRSSTPPGIAHAIGSIFPGVVAAVGAYILLARRTGKQLEAAMAVAQKEMMARKPERAVQALRGHLRARALAVRHRLQPARQHRRAALRAEEIRRGGAAPAQGRHHHDQALAGAGDARRHPLPAKQYDEMEKVFDGAMRGNKGETLLYAVYAWCEHQRGEKKKALEVLQKGREGEPLRREAEVAAQPRAERQAFQAGRLG